MGIGSYGNNLTVKLEVSDVPVITSGAGVPTSTPSQLGDIYIDTTNDTAYIGVDTVDSGDWFLIGSGAGIASVAADTTPQLGGNLDVQTHSIVSTTNQDINITPNGTGNVLLGVYEFDADQSLGAGQDNYVLTYDNGSGVISLEASAGGGGGDLWSDVVDAVITPDADGTRDFGLTGTRFATGYFDNINITTNITVGGTVDGRDIATDGTKLDGIEASADVTDVTNVTAAGALMDSEVTNLAQVKAFDTTDYATAAQGTTADSALQPGDAVTTLDGTANRFIYVSGTGDVTELALGASGEYLKSQGATSAPTWDTPAGGSPEGTAVLSTGETGGSKFLREDGDGTSSWQAIPGGGDALTGSPLSQFAATTSAQFAGVISDETGTGSVVLATSPTLVTPALGTPSALVGTNITGTASGLTAGNVTTNANLTGHVTSTGNAAVLGSFTAAQLDTAVSDDNVLFDSEVTNLAQVKAFDTTDYATAAQGTTADSAMQDLVDDTDPDLGGDLDINLKGIVQTFTAQTGSSFTIGEVGYVDTTNEVVKADASAESTSKGLMVMATGTINADTSGDFLLFGYYTGLSGLTAGEQFLSETAGAMTTTKPTTGSACVRKLAYAPTTTTIWFNPSMDYVVI